VADILYDGTVRVAFVPTIASLSAPTTTELNAGILLQSLITADGLIGFDPTTAPVDNTSLASTFSTKTIGRDEFDGTMLRLKKQTATDTAYNTLTRGTAGFIAIRRDIAETTAWASSQLLETHPVIFGQRKRLTQGSNEVVKWEAPCMITSAPNLAAVVA
jgi:hypothetical protein